MARGICPDNKYCCYFMHFLAKWNRMRCGYRQKAASSCHGMDIEDIKLKREGVTDGKKSRNCIERHSLSDHQRGRRSCQNCYRQCFRGGCGRGLCYSRQGRDRGDRVRGGEGAGQLCFHRGHRTGCEGEAGRRDHRRYLPDPVQEPFCDLPARYCEGCEEGSADAQLSQR